MSYIFCGVISVSENFLLISNSDTDLGSDPRSAAGADAGSGPPSALGLSSTTSGCDYCTADSARGTDWGAAAAGAHKDTYTVTHWTVSLIHLGLVSNYHLSCILAASPVGGSCCRWTADSNPDSGSSLPHSATGQCREKGARNNGFHIAGSRCPSAS